MHRRTIITIIAVFAAVTAVATKSEDNCSVDTATVKLYRNGAVTTQLTIDSITVEETLGPVIPGRNVAMIMLVYDSLISKSRQILVINGKETPLPMPDNEEDYTPTFIGYSNDNLYVVGQRQTDKGKLASWTWNYEYAVWKNFEYQYTISDNRFVCPFGIDICLDGEDLYLFGSTSTSLSEADSGKDYVFFFKNNEKAKILTAYGQSNVIDVFDVEKGKVYVAYMSRLSSSYHSTSSAWSQGQITELWCDGESYYLQRVDRSKLIYNNGMKVHNGVAHIVGYTDLLGGYFNGKTERLISAYYYDGNSTHEDPYYNKNYCINIDEYGNVYIVSHRKELDDQEDAFVVLKNGSELYELPDGEPNWLESFSSGAKKPRIFFDGSDVYVLARGFHKGEDEEYHYNDMIWKNNQLFWKSGDRYPQIYKIVIY